MSHTETKNHELVKQFIDEFPTRKGTIASALNFYLDWRRISIEDLIENGLDEKKHFIHYINENSLNRNRTTYQNKISEIRKFLIFHGVEFSRNKRLEKKKFYYEDDIKMQEYLLCFRKESTQRVVKLYLSKYCEYRKMSPTELLEEAKDLTENELRVILMQFHKTLTIKDSWRVVSIAIRFYFRLGDKRIYFMQSEKPKRKKKLFHLGKELVDKQVMKELLEEADLRDSMILFTMFESGMNSIDLSTLTYGHFKDYLDLENPENSSDIVVMVHTREKTYCEFLACFGKQSLYYISRWLQHQKKEFAKRNQNDISDDYPIFTDKRFPFPKLSSEGIGAVPKRISKKIFNKVIRASDFRNSFNTRAKQMLKHYDKELFMGHAGGMERHYDVSDLNYFENEYRRTWDTLFDLSYDNEIVGSLEKQNTTMKKELREMKDKIKSITSAMELLDKIVIASPVGEKPLTEEEQAEHLEQLRKAFQDELKYL